MGAPLQNRLFLRTALAGSLGRSIMAAGRFFPQALVAYHDRSATKGGKTGRTPFWRHFLGRWRATSG